MLTSLRRFVLGTAVALVVWGISTTESQAQFRALPNSQMLVNPAYRVAPNLPLNQATYNIRAMGNAYSRVPPWVFGYNPYPSPIIMTPYYPMPVYPFSYTPMPYSTSTLSASPYSAFNPYGFTTY